MEFLNMDHLARRTGITRRTIRYYVSRGLLKPPEGGGRGHYYTGVHIEQIERINAWRAQGVPLEVIKKLMAKGEKPSADLLDSALPIQPRPPVSSEHVAPRKETWKRYRIAPGLELSVMAGAFDESECEVFCVKFMDMVRLETRKRGRK